MMDEETKLFPLPSFYSFEPVQWQEEGTAVVEMLDEVYICCKEKVEEKF